MCQVSFDPFFWFIFHLCPIENIFVSSLKMQILDKVVCVSLLADILGKVRSPSVIPPHSRGAHGIMVIIVGNGHGDTSSNSGMQLFSLQLWVNSRADYILQP